MTLTLTPKAEFRLRAFLLGSASSENSEQKGIRVSVNDGGCSGYQYALDITNNPQDDDLVIEQGRVRVYIDQKSAPLLKGVVIDYVEGLIESGFKFSNPNATDTCGCGQSFQAGDCTPTGTPCS
ncbi:MAG: iron-sulfur cluster assembly accessory protein [Coleofasciculaceae cyanobacterium]